MDIDKAINDYYVERFSGMMIGKEMYNYYNIGDQDEDIIEIYTNKVISNNKSIGRYHLIKFDTFNNLDAIMRNWSRICFPKHKLKLKSIDKVKIGKSIKEQRLYHGMSLKFVAELLHISEATLKSYEMGIRLVRLDVIYQLSQIYNMSIDDLVHSDL